jgi:CheY-like chemotaxis protein
MKLVLIVEDDEDTRIIYEDALRERGYRVQTATNGAEGVHLARRYQPDLIVLDLRMPVMSGFDAMRYLKSDPHTASIPVCGISAYGLDDEEMGNLSTDAFVRFVSKPLDPPALADVVEELVGPSPHLGYPPAE